MQVAETEQENAGLTSSGPSTAARSGVHSKFRSLLRAPAHLPPMDFQALLGQISELEAANIEETRKLLEESAKHKVRALISAAHRVEYARGAPASHGAP